MKKSDFKKLLAERVLITDGATGTELQKRGYLKDIGAPEELNIKFPDRIKDVHLAYLKAGSDVILTNTFGANRHKLSDYKLENHLVEINQNAVSIARDAAKDFNALIGADIGPIGSYLEPLGNVTFDKAYELFSEQVKALNAANPDFIVIETMAEIREVKAALLAAKDNFVGPVITQMTFAADGSTVTGTDILSFLAVVESMGADGIGLNCSVGPHDLFRLAKILAQNTSLPISFKPNAGMPKLVNRETVFPGTAEDFVEMSLQAHACGVNLFGGCCGTSPEFISKLASALKGKKPSARKINDTFFISSRTKALDLNKKPFFIIGERINPTNRKKFQSELGDSNFSTIRKEAKDQVKSGADVLDINMGVPGADEVSLVKRAVEEIQEVVQVPLCIDSSSVDAIEVGLKTCAGKPIINSVNGDEDKLLKILSLAKRYGAAVIGLCTDHKGLPKTTSERMDIARRILDFADKTDFNRNEIIFDFLTLSISAASDQTIETLNAIKTSNEVWPKNKTVLGLSNISFGMPNRQLINSSFLKLAKSYGLSSAILNPHEDWSLYDITADNLLLGKDPDGKTFISKYGGITAKKSVSQTDELLPVDKRLYYSVMEGNREEVGTIVKEALEKGFNALTLANSVILEALNEVGAKFNVKEYFLPQVIRSAEAAQTAFTYIKPLLKKDSSFISGKVLLATVKGDVHDIGKNIVAAVFESHGWDVLDLGKNVDTEVIIETAQKENCRIIGLSALMTTTMLEMEKVIKLKNQLNKNIKIIIGGAPVTEKFAEEIGADAYAKDAVKAVEVASLLNK